MKYYLVDRMTGKLLFGKLYFTSRDDANEYALEQGLEEWHIIDNSEAVRLALFPSSK